MPFTKMHGIGNDYVYVDAFAHQVPDPARVARLVSPRRTGIGSDGLILICPSSVADARMEMYNADGSRGEMCGNGIRCVAKYVYDHGIARKPELKIETDAGVKTLKLDVRDGRVASVTVDMGEPILDGASIPVRAEGRVIDAPFEVDGTSYRITCVSMGNPHCVLFVDDTASAPVTTLGPRIETDPFFPKRVNVEFVQLLDPAPSARLRMRVWERGSGETAACGTGACAVAVAAHLTERAPRRVEIELLGGNLQIEWRESDGHVYMTGPATEVFSGEVEV
ncbi:MAG TPA: diaminopimelate epimerase [Candidatus Binatia bacterium]